ncbi:uncharacterized protein (TIGR02001 family) [Natronocella acetinitrilica]|uniref:Uncharacterized protein (TIGR02001 family) n=1 Tax=Natronocella acetinitrilica TaxID=414046 RepID=A0AAE3KAL4_9GAMM|nr:TorF family putative porin [Natronocella acetinitrilica]MCP1674480.1 uncharacterized protein (TIGR02001 family) [Natronocella acetinitrilica]
MMTKPAIALAAALALASCQPAFADTYLGAGLRWSGELTLASNDTHWGESTTGGRPALSGGLRLDHDSGAYLGNRNVSLRNTDGQYLEMAFYGGYRAPLGEAIALDLGLIQSRYPGAPARGSQTAAYAGLVYAAIGWRAGARIESEVSRGRYTELLLHGDYALGLDSYVFAELGAASLDSSDPRNGRGFGALGVGHALAGLDLRLGYHASTLSRGKGGGSGQVVGSIGARF